MLTYSHTGVLLILSLTHSKGNNMKQTPALLNFLKSHGYELWNGYLVEQYSLADNRPGATHGIPGVSFTPLSSIDTWSDLWVWAGY